MIIIRLQLLEKVKSRKEQIGMTIDNISRLSHLGNSTVTRFLSGDDVKLSTVEKVTELLGLDLAGNEMIDIKTLKDKRAVLDYRVSKRPMGKPIDKNHERYNNNKKGYLC